MYLLLLAVIYLAFISLGLPHSLLGSAWPTVRVEFDVPLSYMGMVSMIISGGTIISGLLSERRTKKFGTKVVTTVSVFLTAVALFGFSTTTEFYQMCLWGIPYGLGAGAIISPYIMSYALTYTAWTNGYRMVSYVQFGIVVVLILTLPLWKINKATVAKENSTPVLGIKGALKIKGVPYLLLGFLSYCAAALGSLFFIGITVGRFLAGFISDKLGDNRMIRLGTGIALAGVLCLCFPVKILSILGFIIICLGCAPVYPCIIHATPKNFGAENSQGIIGIQMASAYVGSTFMPPVFGLIANYVSLKLMPVYLAFFLILLLFMISKTEKACGGGVR